MMVRSDDKNRARLYTIKHVLHTTPYAGKDTDVVIAPGASAPKAERRSYNGVRPTLDAIDFLSPVMMRAYSSPTAYRSRYARTGRTESQDLRGSSLPYRRQPQVAHVAPVFENDRSRSNCARMFQ